ncbi:hypothetical protein TcBrA4_0115260 [Trypanosoma cruzi]|nr:hypothetical protein TcBrA4_0115260 [Trypanosoma cruzi]
MLKVVPSELQFGAVAVNDVPVYCRFSVVNTDPMVSLSVQFTATTVPAVIRFQLWDEMLLLDDDEIDSGGAQKDRQKRGTLSLFYSALFEGISVIDRLLLGPLESREVVAIFHADPVQFSTVMVQAPPAMVSGVIQLTAASLPSAVTSSPSDTDANRKHHHQHKNSNSHGSGSSSFAMFNSSLHLVDEKKECNPQANKISPRSTPRGASKTEMSSRGDAAVNESRTKSDAGGRHDPQTSSLSLLFSRSPTVAAVRSETVTLPFSASVFLSLLTVSRSELRTTMAPGKTHLMDFTVTNASSLPLPFVIRSQTIPQKNVEFSLYEEDKFEEPKIGRTLWLDRHASMNFTLMVRTSATALAGCTTGMQEYRAVLQCDNLRDARNSELVYVHINVVAIESQTDLVSVTDPVLDFGEVYRGTRVIRELNICNTSRENVTVRLLDSRPDHCEGVLSLVRSCSTNGNGNEKNNASRTNTNSNTSSNDKNKNEGNNSNGNEKNDNVVTVDEVLIVPQKGSVPVGVMYVPSTDQENKATSSLNFEFELVITGVGGSAAANAGSDITGRHQQRLLIRSMATLFTSTIVASQKNINFGDCQVGQSRRCTFAIENPSPLPTTIYVQLRSKIVSIEGVQPRVSAAGGCETLEEFSVAPRSSLPITLRINPKRVNSTYRKQLTIVNVSNPAEDRIIVNIEANNMAPSETKLHDELYTCESKAHCDDGNVNGGGRGEDGTCASGLRSLTNVPLIVAYSLQSKVEYPLVLQLKSSSTEIETFFLEGMSENEFEAIAAELRAYCCYGCEEVVEQFSVERAEEVRNSVVSALQHHTVVTSSITLEPRGGRTFYVRIDRTTGDVDAVTKEDGISIAVEGIEVPRFVRLSYRLCRTRFQLNGQKTKNFGEVNIGERRTTKLPIVNQCNSLLLLQLSKSRSVTAGHIRMENSDKKCIYCRIRPYATKELELSFYPGIKGSFEERIRLTNVLDPSNEVIMTMKATVTKAETFDVSPNSWSFGVVPVPLPVHTLKQVQGTIVGGGGSGTAVSRDDGMPPSVRIGARFSVVNTSNTRRELCLKLDTPAVAQTAGGGGAGSSNPGSGNANSNVVDAGMSLADRFFKFDGVDVRMQLEMEHGGASSGSIRKLEEKIEKLEQKLKIYRRKNKMEKVVVAMRQIELLRCALMGKEVDPNTTSTLGEAAGAAGGGIVGPNELSESEDEKMPVKPKARQLQHPELLSLLLCDGVALPEMNACESTIIVLTLTCTRTTECIPPAQSGTITFLLCETKDKEANRVIPVDITLVPMEGEDDGEATAASTRPTAGSKLFSTPSTLTIDGLAAGNSPPQSVNDTSFLAPGAELANALSPLKMPVKLATPVPTPSFFIEPGEGVVSTSFMRCPMAIFTHAIAYEACKFTMLLRATDETAFVVLDPVRCCGNIINSNLTNNGTSTVSGGNAGNSNSNTSSAHVNNAPAAGGGGGGIVSSTAVVPIRTLDAHFKFVPRNGVVRASESFSITVECTPMSVVPQRYFIPIKKLQHPSDITYFALEMNPMVDEDLLQVSPREILLRDIVMPCDESRLEVQSFVVCSRFTMPHALLIRSNRPLLVSLFEDAKCTIPLVSPVHRVFLHEKLRIYVRFRPSERSWRRTSRLVTAGILVEAIASEMGRETQGCYSVLAQTTLRLSAHVGSGEVLLRENFIDLGAVPPHCRLAHTSFTLSNPSDRFEVRLRVMASLTLTQVETPELKLSPGAEVQVPVSLQLASPGLLQESLTVFNLSCRQKPLPIGLSILRLDEAISATVEEKGDELQKQQQQKAEEQCAARRLREVPMQPHLESNDEAVVVVLPTAAVVLGEDAVLRLHGPVTTATMHMTNHSTRDIILVAKGTAPLVLGLPRPSSPVEEVASPSTLTSHVYSRGRVRLDARQTQAVTWTLTSLPNLTVQQIQCILRHEVVTIEQTAQVYVAQVVDEVVGFNYNAMLFPMKRSLPAVGQCVLLPRFCLTFAMSEGRVETPLIDLGVVSIGRSNSTSDTDTTAPNEGDTDHHHHQSGHGTPKRGRNSAAAAAAATTTATVNSNPARWKFCDHRGSGTQVVIHLTNLSPILPLCLSIECEPTVRFASNHIVVPPLQTHSVEAFLVVKLIRTQGPFRFAVYFVNELNPENDMVAYVTGQYYWKAFDLSCDGVMNIAHESLSMEALRVTETTTTTDILSESKIVMTPVEPNVEVVLGVTENPKLEGLIQLQVLQYDAAAPLQKIVFGQTKHASANKAGSLPPLVLNNINKMNSTNINNNSFGGPGVVSTTDAAVISSTPFSAAAIAAAASAVNSNTGGGSGMGGNTNNGLNNASIGGASSVNTMNTSLVTAVTNSSPSPAAVAAVPAASAVASVPALTKADELVMGVPSRQKEQHPFRLRCLLMREDFAALSAAFYGQRKTKNADIIRERQALTFGKLADLERRRVTGSPSMWLGTLHFSNSLTGADEEVQVFSTLGAFQTFTVPLRITLTPQTASTVSAAAPTRIGGEGGTETNRMHYVAETVYTGELVVSNPCSQHTVVLSITPLRDKAYQDTVAFSCIQLHEMPTPQSEGLKLPSTPRGNVCMTGEKKHTVTNAADPTAGFFFPPPPRTTTATTAAATVLTSEVPNTDETTTTLLSILPQSVQRVRILMRVDASRHQPSVEQAVALVLFDESVPCSVATVRIVLAPLDEMAQQQHKQEQLFLQTSGSRVEARVAAAGSADGGGCEGLLEGTVGVDRSTMTTTTAMRSASPTRAARTSGMRNINAAGGIAASGHAYWASSSSSSSYLCVLSLHGDCQAVAGCQGTYTCRFTYAKDSPPPTGITIRNNLSDTVVDYSVTILSQGPQPWLLLPSATAVLEPGKAQPLRLNILSTGAGSFSGYVGISTSAAPGEMLLLQLTAEVFLPTAGEGLFEIVAPNGQRMSTNTERSVFIGRLFGAGSHRAYVALEIVNRANIPLEFPVSVVKPFRMEFNNTPDEGDDLSSATTTSSNATAATANAKTNAGGILNSGIGRTSSQDVEGAEDDDGKQQIGVDARPECDVRLLVCHLHDVPEMRGQRRFVVDPKSRVNVSFLLVCDRLSLPSGVTVSGEAEVVLKCKQARDARFVLRARFQVCGSSMVSPRQLFFAAAEDYTVAIPVKNLRSREIRVTFRTASPILDVLPGQDREKDGRDEEEMEVDGQPQPGENHTNLLVIPGGGSATVRVRLDVARVAAMLSWGASGDMAAVLPVLYDHGLLLNAQNPSERVRVELCYVPPNAFLPATPFSIAVAAAAQPIAKSLKVGRRQISEQRLFNFVRSFWRVLLEAADAFLPEFQYYTAQRGIEATDATREATSHIISATAGASSNSTSIVNTSSSNHHTHSNNQVSHTTAGAIADYRPVLCSLLVDLTWLVEELVHYSVLLSNSRSIEAYGVFLTAAVTNHPLMRAWRRHKANLPNTRTFAIFGQYWETIDALPCLTPSSD